MNLFTKSINVSIENFNNLKNDNLIINKISKKLVNFCKNKTSKILVCGNGGSANDADHFVTELMIRFKKERRSIPALSLSTNPGLLTACANDYDFQYIFKRQLESLANKNVTSIRPLLHFSRHDNIQMQLNSLSMKTMEKKIIELNVLEKKCKLLPSLSNTLVKKFIISH